jgi:ribokinase
MDLVINSPYMPISGETLKGNSFMTNAGGKGANQAAACGKLGGEIYMAGCVGDDEFGKTMINNLNSYGVNTKYIKIIKNQTSGIAVIVVINGDNRIILDEGANGKIQKEDIDNLLITAESGDIFLTQLENPIEIIGYGLQAAKAKGLYTILNPAPANISIQKYFEFVDLITPNESELKLLSGVEDILNGAKILEEKGIKEAVVTLGSRGYAYIKNANIYYGECKKVKAVDTTAAGDTFCGGLAVQLSKDIEIKEALKFASLAATISVTRKGAQISIPTLDEVLKEKNS